MYGIEQHSESQPFQHQGEREVEAHQPDGNPNITPVSSEPVINAIADTQGPSEPSSAVSLTSRKIAQYSPPQEGDYFLDLLDPHRLDMTIHLPTEIDQTYRKLVDLSLKHSRKTRQARTDQAALDAFLKREDLNEPAQTQRLLQCIALGGVLTSSGNNTEAEKYSLRAYYDLKTETPSHIKQLVYTILFTIYDRMGESRLAMGFLNKHSSSTFKLWITGMVALGMEDRYRNHCAPLYGLSQYKEIGKSNRDFKTQEGGAYHLASNTDIGFELKYIWKLFYPFLLPIRDINQALTRCSCMIAALKKQSEIPEAFYSGIAKLVKITPESPYYQPLKAVLAVLKSKDGEAFWQSLSKLVIRPALLTNKQTNIWASAIVAESIKQAGIEGVEATELLPANQQDYYDYADQVLKALFIHPLSFAIQYDQWLEFLEKSETGKDFAEDNKKVLDQGLAALPDKLNDSPADHCQLPDWIFHSTAPADWSINSIRYLFAIDLPRNRERARQYAKAFKQILPDKGAILEALIHLDEAKFQKAFKVLDLPESNHPGTFLLRANILRNYPNKINITQQTPGINECIVSDYVKAGERGLAKGYIQAAEFLMEKKPNQLNTWEKAADYYRRAANICTETVDQQRNLIMAEFCQAEAYKITPVTPVKDLPLHQDPPTADTVVASEPNAPVTPGLELSVRPRQKVKTDQHDRSALPHSGQPKVQFWPQMKQIYTFMDDNNLSNANAALEKLKIPKDTEAWIQAMVAQNKAWCIKLMLEEGMFSVPAKRNEGKKRGNNRGRQSKPLPTLPPLPTRSKLVDKGQQHLQAGFKALGVNLPSLERVLDRKIEPSIIACDQKKRQYASLLSTLAHFYSLAGEVSKSSKLRELYRKLYTSSHELRDRISV